MHVFKAGSRAACFLALALALTLAGCGGKGKTKNRVEGERLSVLSFDRELDADPALATSPVALPRPYRNLNWPQQGGNTANVHHHLFVGPTLEVAWRKSLPRGNRNYERIVSTPVVANGVLYAMDSTPAVVAMATADGAQLWQTSLKVSKKVERSKVGYGGGVAYWGGRLYATTGFGNIHALDGKTGEVIWTQEVGVPIRGAPTVADGRVYTITQDNQLYALSAEDGEILWDHIGIIETAGVLGAASPAVSGDTVVAAFSSGELFALRAQNGQVAWQDALSRTGSLTALATLNDIDGHPVIDRGRVYAVNHAGRMVAIDVRSGERVWESNIGSIYMPWIVGDYIYVVSLDGEIACLSIRDGRVRWVTQMQRFGKPEKRKDLIRWVGPVLAGDRLFVLSSHGYLLTLSPYTGEILSGRKMSKGSVLPPIVVDQTLYVLTDDGRITAYR